MIENGNSRLLCASAAGAASQRKSIAKPTFFKRFGMFLIQSLKYRRVTDAMRSFRNAHGLFSGPAWRHQLSGASSIGS
jgi:methylphosphotriester-DNA--protein-cysteine methyltransferase